VVSKFPGTDEARRAEAHVRELSPRVPAATTPH